MSYSVEMLGGNKLEITTEAPSSLNRFVIYGSRIISSVGPYGEILLQQIVVNGLTLYYSVLSVKEDISFRIRSANEIIQSHIVFEGNYEYDIKKFGTFFIKGNHFNVLRLVQSDVICSFKNGFHRSLIIEYPVDFFNRRLLQFPSLEEFYVEINGNANALVNVSPISITGEIMAKSYLILTTPYLQQLDRFHVEIIEDITMLLLKQAHESLPAIKFSFDEIEHLYLAKKFIDTNLPKHFTIQQIAKKIGMNQQKLKAGFKDVFNKSIYEYQQGQKIDVAKVHLSQSEKLVKAITALAGFKNESNFCTAFKRATGMTPLQYRKYNKNEK